MPALRGSRKRPDPMSHNAAPAVAGRDRPACRVLSHCTARAVIRWRISGNRIIWLNVCDFGPTFANLAQPLR
jgi:hypothetical protein